MRRLVALVMIVVLCPLGAADFKVARTDDVVKLIDGTEVRGTVIAVGIKAVIVAVEDREVVIPRAKVESIVRGAARAETLKFMTDPVDGVKVITGKGFRDEGPGAEEGELEQPPERKEGEKPARPGRDRKGPKRRIDAGAIRRHMKRDKRFELMVKNLGGPDKVAEMAKNMDEETLEKMLGKFLGGSK